MPNTETNQQQDPSRFLIDQGLKSAAKVQNRQIEEAAGQGVSIQNILQTLLKQNQPQQPQKQQSGFGRVLEGIGRAGLAAQGVDPRLSLGPTQAELQASQQKPQMDIGQISSLINAMTNSQRQQQEHQEFLQNQQILQQSGITDSGEQLAPEAKTADRAKAAVNTLQGFGPEVSTTGPGGPTVTFDTKKKIIDRSFKLADRFESLPEVKDYKIVNTQVNTMGKVLQNALQGDLESKNALDQAIVITFNRILDPQSVVRESEFARTPQGVSLVNRIKGAFQKTKKGGLGMTDQDRVDLVKAARIISNERGKTFNKAIDRMTTRAERSRSDIGIVLGDIQRHELIDIDEGFPQKKEDAVSDIGAMSTEELQAELQRLQGGK